MEHQIEFTQEELTVMRPFDGSCRATLLWELRQVLPDVYQPDVKRAVRSAIGKLEAMTDEAFDSQGMDMDGFGYGWEEDYQ